MKDPKKQMNEEVYFSDSSKTRDFAHTLVRVENSPIKYVTAFETYSLLARKIVRDKMKNIWRK